MRKLTKRVILLAAIAYNSTLLCLPSAAQETDKNTYTLNMKENSQTLFASDPDSTNNPTFKFCVDSGSRKSAVLTLISKAGVKTTETVFGGTCVFVKSQKIDVSRAMDLEDADLLTIRFSYLGE